MMLNKNDMAGALFFMAIPAIYYSRFLGLGVFLAAVGMLIASILIKKIRRSKDEM
jgi:hypothetical protein